MPSTPYSQFIWINHGTNTDEAIKYANESGDTTASNFATGGPTGTNTGITSPWSIVADLPGGFYYIIDPEFTGNGSADGQIHLGFTATPTVAPTTVYTVPDHSPAPNKFGEANAIAIDNTNHILYLAQVVYNNSLDGLDNAQTGIVSFSYNPTTGALGAATAVVTRSGGVTTDANIDEVRQLSLDTTHNVLYFTDDTFGKATNVGANETNSVKAYNTVTHAETTVVTFASGSDTNVEFPTGYTNGTIYGVAADPTDNIVFFSTASGFAGSEALNKIYVILPNGTGQVLLTESATYNNMAPFSLTFDDVHNKLYVSYETTNNTAGHLVVYDVNIPTPGSTAGITLSNPLDIGLNLADPTPDGADYPLTGFIDQLPALTTSGTTTHAAEQDPTKINLLTAPPTITDSDNDHLASAYVQITGGTFVSNETSANDDHLSVLDGVTSKTSGTFTGTNITIAYDSANEKLTLTGYDTLANYATVLSHIQYTTTGDNPTNYGNNPTRTVTWHTSDGALNDPSGTNTTTTTLNIDAKNDAPVNHLPATPSVNEDVLTTISGISITDVDADPANQDITVTFSVVHGTLTFNTAVAGGITGADITAGANGSNTVTLTATQNQINATLSSGTGFRYQSDLNFNSGFGTETLHIVTNDNSHTDSAAFPGAQTDTDDLTITVNAVNDNPNLQPDTTTPVTYIENAAPIALFAGENVDTPLGDVDQSANYAGGSIDLQITAGLVTGDRIDLTGSRFVIVAGNIQDTANGNAIVGTINATNATSHVTISALTSAATPSVVDALIQAFGFDSTSDNPGAGDRTVTLTFNDGGNTGSGGALTDAVTQTVHVTPVNDAPVSTITPTSYSATEQVNLSLKNNGLAVSDVDGNSGNETVTLSVTEGTLTLGAGTSGIIIDSGNGTSSVTFHGTLTQLNDFLNTNATSTVVYNDNTDTPAASATLTLLIHDNGNTGTGGDLSASDTATINITAVNDAPNASMTTDPYAATENVALTLKNTGMTVSDVDALGGVEVATLSVTQGVLNVTAGTSGVTSVTGSGTSSVVVTGTLAQINALLNTDGTSTVSYTETNDNPSATVTLTLQINDQGNTGTGGALIGTDTSIINITAANDAPVATITPTSYSATEQVNLSLKNNGLAVSDVDGNSGNETVTLSVTEGTLTIGAGTSGVIIDSGNGTSSVTFHGTLAQLNDLLNTNATSTVVYNDNTDTPAASATLTLAIHDNGNTGGGDLSANDTATINITAVNDAPNASMTTDPYTATEQTALVLKGTGMSVSDVDALGASETITLSVGEGALTVTQGDSGVTVVSGNGTSSVQVSGTLAQLNALLAAGGTSNLTYIDNSDNPSASTTLTLQINDGGNTGTGGAHTGTDTSTINITAVNDAPVATITPTEYDGSPNVAINLKSNGLSVSDVDGNAGSETVTLSVTSGTLTVTTGGSGAGVAGSGTSSVTITGTTAQINALLNTDGTSTVSYVDSAGGTKTLTLLIHDNGNTGGGDLSAQDTANIVLDQPPVVDLNGATAGTGSTLNYAENAAASAIAPTGTTTDTDSTDFNTGSLTVHFSANGAAEDQLSILTDGTVTVSSGTVSVGGLAVGTVSGGTNGSDLVVSFNTTDATPASVSTLIEHIGYANSSDNPSTLARSVLFTVNDGDGASGSDTATVNVTAVNDAPVSTITPTTYSATEQTSLSLKNNGLAVSDVDGNAGSETVTLSVAEGTLTVTAGGSGAGVAGSGTSSVTITGTIAQINALLNTDATSTVSYIDNTDDPSASATLTLLIHDNGNTGTGGDLSASDTATINITSVNDPPVLHNVPAAADYTENAAPVTFSAVFPNEIFVTDPDPVPHGAPGGNGLALSATVKISGGFVAGDELLVFDTTTATSSTSGFYTGINIQWDYDATTHILTLFSADAPTNSGDTLVDFAHVLDNIQFDSTSDDPTNGGVTTTRTLQWQIQDAGGTANGGNDLSAIYTTTLTVHATNDAPVAAITPTSYSATEQTALSLKNNGIAVSDVDGGAGSETVTLSVGEGVLNVTTGGSGAGVAGSGTGSVTITGSAAQINALLNTDGTSTVSYIDNSDTPGASTTLTLLIHDNGNTGTGGDLSSSDTATINITAVNDAPQLSGFGDASAFVEQGSSVILDTNGNASVSDPELNVSANNFAGASLTIARTGGANSDDSFVGTGSLDLVDVSGTGENVSLDGGATFIGTFTNPGDGSLTFVFNANATAADVDQVMRQIAYSNGSDNPPTSVQIDFTFSDGNGQPGGQAQGTGASPGTAIGSFTVNITQVDDAPVLINVAPSASYSPGSAGVVLSSALGVFDVDATPPSTLQGIHNATVSISNGFFAGDQLFVNLPTSGGFFIVDDGSGPVVTNISVTSNVAGTMVLGGTDTTLHYQLVLDAVDYRSTAADPSNGGVDPNRTITWQVNDGALNSQTPNTDPNNLVNATILHFDTAPAVDLDASGPGTGFTTTYTENQAPIPIADTDLSITDPDTANLDSATIVLTNAKAGDTLSIAGALPAGIDSTIDTSVAGQITLRLLNSATVADYQTAVGQIRFSSSSELPDTTNRDITVFVSESGSVDSNVAHATVHVVSVNDAPVNTVPVSPLSAAATGSVVITGLSVSDLDAANGSETTILSVQHGTLNVTAAGGASVIGSGTGSVTVTGTLSAINATLMASGNVAYHSTSGFMGVDTLTMTTNDNGNTGGAPLTDTDLVFINNFDDQRGAPSPLPHGAFTYHSPVDLNGDGMGDILFRQTTGTIDAWLLNGPVKQVDQVVSALGNDWHVAAKDDFNGDGKTDILLRHDNGTVALWTMNGAQKAADQIVSALGNDWHIAATDDFNGDGKSDILLRHDNGTIALWTMNGAQKVGDQVVSALGNDWHIAATDDFNGDGKSDILLRHDNGTIALWTMNGAQKVGDQVVSALGNDWHVALTADFNGDGKADILLRHDNGTVAIWTMNGAQKVADQVVGPMDNSWHLLGAGDFNADGHADLLWRNDNGAVEIWEMNGAQKLVDQVVGPMGNDWHFAGLTDANNDHMTDILWRHDDGTVAIWEMNGAHKIADQIVSHIGNDWVIA
jgi:hypothetical protein